MARQSRQPIAFDALTIEGALLAPDMLGRIGAAEAGEQTEADYRLEPGTKLRDEIGFAFAMGETLWARFRQSRKANPGISGVERFAFDLLRQVFGFDSLVAITPPTTEGRSFPIRYAALDGRVPVVIAQPPLENARRGGLDESHEWFGDGGRKRSATLLVQEYLNAEDQSLWGLALDGVTLRILRDNASMTRPAWIEANLERIFTDRLFADFSVLWLLLHESRFGQTKTPPTDCPLERWRERARAEGVKARERLRDGVEAALLALGSGFLKHPANQDLRTALTGGRFDAKGYFQELLRLVYRLIFLFTGEDRGLLHPHGAPDPARKLYAEGYSLARLRERAVRRTAYDSHHDLFEGAKIVFRALASGQPKLALPALGGLFLPGTTPHLDAAKLGNRDLLTAIYRLAWLIDRDSGRIERVNWRDMETEELGSVYESLLELAPRVTSGAGGFEFAGGAEAKGNARKTTGSYYTPDSLVQLLLDSALDPVIEAAVAAKPGRPVDALLDLTVIDPACGSGHFLLAAARRIAARIAREQSPGAPSGDDYRHALREVARHCLYGVDRNPLAVELCKVAIWIETVEPGKPLSFLDGRIRQGDSLIGVFDLASLADGVPDEAYKPLTGDDKAVAKYYATRNRKERKDRPSLPFAGSLATLSKAASRLDAMPEDDLAGIAAKQQALTILENSPEAWTLRVACDLFVAAFFAPKTGEVPKNPNTVTIPTTDHLWRKLDGQQLYGPLEAAGIDLSGRVSAFHWPLVFPEVFAKGGFDCVLGNPPWEVSQLDEIEYFSSRSPDIAALAGDARKRAIRNLESDAPHLWSAFLSDKQNYDAANEFFRSCGRFELTARGKINTYSLFAEHFSRLSSQARRGRAGIIVPTGIATDSTTSAFFGNLVEQKLLAQLTDFENREGIFPDVHRSYKFCALVMAKAEKAKFAFFLTNPSQLNQADRSFVLTAEQISQINPNTKTAPIFRSPADAALTAKICALHPILIKIVDNVEISPYHVDIILNFFSTSNKIDMALFTTFADVSSSTSYTPVLRGSSIHQYDHRFSSYEHSIGSFAECPSIKKADQAYYTYSDKYVPQYEVYRRLHDKNWQRGWLMGWRDICRSTDERTVIAAAFPAFGADDTLSLLIPRLTNAKISAMLLGQLNCITLDYVAHQKVGGTHIRKHVIAQFPVINPDTLTEADLTFIVPRVLELTYTSHSMKPFAEDLGYTGPPFGWDEDRRALLRAELDAWIARLYGLTRDELRYILDPADVMGPDYPSETFRVLKENEKKRFGEYRTQRLVLAAWDAQERGDLRDTSPSVTIDTRQAAAGSPPPALPDLVTLPNDAWARTGGGDDSVLAQLAALIRALPGPTSIADVRCAALYALEPRYLTGLLAKGDRTTWCRLVGPESAVVRGANIAAFAPTINAPWRNAVTQLRGMKALIEDVATQTWAAGPKLDEFAVDPKAWAYGRAAFALRHLQSMTVEDTIADLAVEDQEWVRSNAA
jgi:hypothetical protein